jgi:hypothetical protein
MRRRDKTGGKAAQRPKMLRRRNASKAVRRRGLSVADLQEQLDRRNEALAQQAASTEGYKSSQAHRANSSPCLTPC